MPRDIVVLDTNVLVSALLNPFGAPARLLALVTSGDLVAAYDERILAEWNDVLRRPRFAFPSSEIDALLRTLEREGLRVSGNVEAHLPDPDDASFLEVAATCGATLITGNVRHFPPEYRLGVTVTDPSSFLASRGAPV